MPNRFPTRLYPTSVVRICAAHMLYILITAPKKISPAHGCSLREICPPPRAMAIQKHHGE